MTIQSHQNSQVAAQRGWRIEDDKLYQLKAPQSYQMNQRSSTRLLQHLSLNTKIVGLALTIGTPLLLVIEATACGANPLITQEIPQKQNTAGSFAEQVSRFIIESKKYSKINKVEHLLNYVPKETLNGTPHSNWEVALAVNTDASAPQGKSLLMLAIQTGMIALLGVASATFLAKWGISPILKKNNQSGKLSQGDPDTPFNTQGEDELAVLGSRINLIAEQLQVLVRKQAEQSRQQEAEAKQAQIFTDTTLLIRRSLNFQEILKTAVDKVRSILSTDRVIIYHFDEAEQQGTVISESVAFGWTPALDAKIDNSCFSEQDVNLYKNGLARAINDIYQAGLTNKQIKTWERFEVKANLVAPIIKDKQLFGLLIAHQCSAPRVWQQSEIDLCLQLAIQVGFALDQASLLEQVEKARQAEEVISSQQRQQKEALQASVLKLLNDVEEAARGNLTVRADVTEGEIGTVADFFNAIVESLRQLVMKVKATATQVNVDLGEKEGALEELTEQAFQQAQDITRTLNSVEQMSRSIQSVANNARQAAVVAHTASTTAETGGKAIALTFQSILSLRENISDTARKVQQLGESSRQISQVVSLINQIALQTNVLAINAGIEATRAGEEGRGFAVVAKEVGQLAVQASAATQQITKIVENIQLETDEAVRAMEQGTAQVGESTNLVADAKLSLQQIVEVSRQIDNLVQSISGETVSQAQTAQAVADLMQEIALISSQTSDSSRQVSSSLQQTVEVARQLQDSVGIFKLEVQN